MRVRVAAATAALFTASVAGVGISQAHNSDQERAEPLLTQQRTDFSETAEAAVRRSDRAPSGFARCVKGIAADTYPCKRVTMLSRVSLKRLGLSFASDMWGWTDRKTGKDYAIVGGIEGSTFVDISRPRHPDVVGTLPSHTSRGSEFWRDIKVRGKYAYVVSEHSGHGLQVFDLRTLRGVRGTPITLPEAAHYDRFDSAHNVAINPRSGYAYVVGSDTCRGGLHMVDISSPERPRFVGCWSRDGYFHDTQCVNYHGPDPDYAGREICVSANVNYNPHRDDFRSSVSIVDVTDKADPVRVANVTYPRSGYSHQGWLTPGHRYYLHGDEFDEQKYDINTRTRIWDMRDLDSPRLIGRHDYGTRSVDHNLFIEGDRAYASHYTSGLRVLDTRRVGKGRLREVGFFDVRPENNRPVYKGTWSNFPYFARGRIVGVTSMDRGLFILRPRR